MVWCVQGSREHKWIYLKDKKSSMWSNARFLHLICTGAKLCFVTSISWLQVLLLPLDRMPVHPMSILHAFCWLVQFNATYLHLWIEKRSVRGIVLCPRTQHIPEQAENWSSPPAVQCTNCQATMPLVPMLLKLTEHLLQSFPNPGLIHWSMQYFASVVKISKLNVFSFQVQWRSGWCCSW